MGAIINGANFSNQIQQHTEGQQVTQQQSGTDSTGDKYVAKQPKTSMTDMAEELSMGMASQRKDKDKKKFKTKNQDRTAAAQRLMKYMQKLPEINKSGKLESFMDSIRSQKKKSPRELLRQAREQFDDVTHQHAALSAARDLATDDNDFEAVAALDAAIDELNRDHDSEIKAGYNVSALAAEHAKEGFATLSELRDFYREVVLGFESVPDTFMAIIEKYPIAKFGQAVDFLMKGIGTELQSSGPSVDKFALRDMVEGLFHLKTLKTTHDGCSNVMARLKRHGLQTENSGTDLMKGLVGLLKENWVNEHSFNQILEDLEIKDLELKIYCLREFKWLVSKLPDKLFQDESERSKIKEKAQDVLDIEIEKEEALYDMG